MTTQETTTVEAPTTTVDATPETKKFALKPILKKALIWSGAAAGLVLLTALATSANTRRELENDAIVEQDYEDGFENLDTATPEITD